MSDPLHIIVTLSPETIAALAEAMRPKPRRERRDVEPVPTWATRAAAIEEVRTALSTLPPGFTMRALLAAMGVRADRPTTTRVGLVLRRLGYLPGPERTASGVRERIYSAPQGEGLVPDP